MKLLDIKQILVVLLPTMLLNYSEDRMYCKSLDSLVLALTKP